MLQFILDTDRKFRFGNFLALNSCKKVACKGMASTTQCSPAKGYFSFKSLLSTSPDQPPARLTVWVTLPSPRAKQERGKGCAQNWFCVFSKLSTTNPAINLGTLKKFHVPTTFHFRKYLSHPTSLLGNKFSCLILIICSNQFSKCFPFIYIYIYR